MTRTSSGRSVLIVGQGGREHALAWKLRQQGKVGRLMVAPGNAGIAEIAECFPVAPTDLVGQVELARREHADLVVVAPDDPLGLGLVDLLADAGIRAFGPTAAAARIESSKAYAKDLMARAGVPTAAFRTFTDPDEALAYVRGVPHRVFVKASGLAAGKGAIFARDGEEATRAIEEIMVERAFGAAGDAVVVEEFMEGEEASLFAICDGEHFRTFVPAQDHKTVYDGDTGPNTGGMGAYAPAPVMTPERVREAEERIIAPTLRALAADGAPFRGMLYAGLMIGPASIRVVEFNCRWGDPEAQVILPLLRTDLLALMDASIDGTLDRVSVEHDPGAAVIVMLASGGYPGSYEKGRTIAGIDRAAGHEGVVVFHSGTARRDGVFVTNGGRVLGVAAVAPDIRVAVERAYGAVAEIGFQDMHYRRDIAHRALKRTT